MAEFSVFKFMSYAIHGPQLIIVNGKHHVTIRLARRRDRSRFNITGSQGNSNCRTTIFRSGHALFR